MTEIQYKRCTKCKQEFPKTEEFFRYRKFRNSFFSKCRVCEKLHDAEKRKNNPERFSLAQKRFRLNHPERSKAIKKHWNDSNKEYQSIKAAKKYAENRDVFLARNKNYTINHPEKRRARSQKRRALMKNAEGNHTSDDIKIIYDNQQGKCAYCGISIYWNVPHDVHIDHIQPLSRGGSNWPDNIACACADCNLTKGEKTITEWEKVRGW